MLPIFLNPEKINILLVGGKNQAKKRKKLLKELGVKNVKFISYKKTGKITQSFAKKFNIAFIADSDDFNFLPLYKLLKANIAFVNVEDKIDYCDFHFPSIINKGSIKIAISTEGKSPFFGKFLKEKIESLITKKRLKAFNEIAKKRIKWKKQKLSLSQISQNSKEVLDKYED